MPTGNGKYYDRDARPSRSRDTVDESIPARDLITYNDTSFVVLDEVSDDGEKVWNKLEDIGNISEYIRSSRHARIGEEELSKTEELYLGKYNKCREAPKRTKSERYTNPTETSSRKRRYNLCENAYDKSEDLRNYIRPKRKSFDNRVVYCSENISSNCHRRDPPSQNPIIDNTVCFPDSPDRSTETYSKRDRRSKPHTSHKRKQTSDIQVQFDNHTECTFIKSGESNIINRKDPVLYDNEMSTETQIELTENSTILPYSDFTKKTQSASFQYNDQRTFQNNGSSDRNMLYNDRGSIEIEHQSVNYNKERDIPDSIIRDGKFGNDTNFQDKVFGNKIHVNPNFIFPRKTLQDGLHVQNRSCQVKRYFNTNIIPLSGHIPQINTYDNVTNLLTNSTNANIAVQLKNNVSNDIAKSTSTHSHKDIVQAHDDEKHEEDLRRIPEYIPLEVDIRLISVTGETGHASPHNIQTTDSVAEQVITSSADIEESNVTTEETDEGTMIENNSKTNSNILQAVIEYPNTGTHSDSISPDICPLPSWKPLKYEIRDILLDTNKDDGDIENKSNHHFGDQNELTIWNGKSASETLFHVGGELTGISIQDIDSNPPNVSRTMQRSDTVVADASVERQDIGNDDQHEIQAKKNMQTCITSVETEKHEPGTEHDYELSSTIQLCITDQTTMEEEGNTEVSDNVDIIDTNKTIPSAMDTAVAFEFADEGDCYHLRRLNCMWQLRDTRGIWNDTDCTESRMLDALHEKFAACRKNSPRETKHPGTY